MRTWKIEGPPEIVDGIVMKVITSCSLRSARRARKPPMAWMPSWELPAMRMTASETWETLGVEGAGVVATVGSLMAKWGDSQANRAPREIFGGFNRGDA